MPQVTEVIVAPGLAWDNGATTNPALSVDLTGCNYVQIAVCWRASGAEVINTITVGGISASIQSAIYALTSPGRNITIFELYAPLSGSNVIACTASSGINNAVVWVRGCANVNQSTPSTGRQNFDAISPFSHLQTTLSAVVNDLCADYSIVVSGNPTTLTVTAANGQTQQTNVNGSAASTSSTSSKLGAASVTMGWDYTPSATYNAIVSSVVIKGAAGNVIGGMCGRQRPVGRGPQMNKNRRSFKATYGSNAQRQVLLQIFSSPGVPLANTQLQFWTALNEGGVAIDGLAPTLLFTTDNFGFVLLQNLRISAGPGQVRCAVPGDPTRSRNFFVTFI